MPLFAALALNELNIRFGEKSEALITGSARATGAVSRAIL